MSKRFNTIVNCIKSSLNYGWSNAVTISYWNSIYCAEHIYLISKHPDPSPDNEEATSNMFKTFAYKVTETIDQFF